MAFTFTPLARLPDILLIETTSFADMRGWFVESYRRSVFASAGIQAEFVQENQSFSRLAGTLRGLHFQVAPAAQGKLVRPIAGEIFDVVVDVRPGASFGRWASVRLAASAPMMLWIPEGFAHGFQTLVPDTAVIYKTTAEYSPGHERGIRWDDPTLAIPWPIPDAVLSERDRKWPGLAPEP